MTTVKQNLAIAGLNVDVFSAANAAALSTEVVAFFLLHGRLSSSKEVERIAESLIQLTREAPDAQIPQRDLIVITFVSSYNTSMKHTLDLRPGSSQSWNPRIGRPG